MELVVKEFKPCSSST